MKSITFKVSDIVEENQVEDLDKRKFEFLSLKTLDRQERFMVDSRNPSLFENKDYKILASSNPLNTSSIYLGRNSFILSAYEAYAKHHHLVLRPDDIWIAIMVQFSCYVNANENKLRNKFVDFQGKKELEIKSEGNLFNAPYDQMTVRMAELLSKNIRDPSLASWAIPTFSTSTPTDKIIGSIALMATMKKYFTYKYSLLCGLPKVTLKGDVQDWKEVKERCKRLKQFDAGDRKMKKWLKLLLPVMDQFIATASGHPDSKWWNQIANHVGGGSGPTYLSGWCTCFCVFDDDGNWNNLNSVHTDTLEGILKSPWIYVNTMSIPTGFLSVPIKINDNGVEHNAEIYAGHFSAHVPDPTTIVPQLDWCIIYEQR
eukprot:gene4553-5673_t